VTIADYPPMRREDIVQYPSRMHATWKQFQEINEEAWKHNHADAMECRTIEALIDRVGKLWDSDGPYFASVVPGSVAREDARHIASVLRAAEQAMSTILQRAMKSLSKGYTVDGLERLIACLNEVRSLIVRPMARRMSERDPEGRTPEQIIQLLMRRVRFQDGRPVISEDVAAELPCPFDPEPTV
jgi:hypothetical protein